MMIKKFNEYNSVNERFENIDYTVKLPRELIHKLDEKIKGNFPDAKFIGVNTEIIQEYINHLIGKNYHGGTNEQFNLWFDNNEDDISDIVNKYTQKSDGGAFNRGYI